MLSFRQILCILLLTSWTNSGIKAAANCSRSPGVSCDPDDVKFYLYPTSSNSGDYDELVYNDLTSVSNSRFDSTKKLILLIHGYTQTFQSQFPVNVRDAYLQNGYTETNNIVSVDWGKLSAAFANSTLPTIIIDLSVIPTYIDAFNNVKIVGQRVADFIIFLIQNQKTSKDKVHVLGQSLGAHAAGYAGQVFKNNTSQLLDRITGTDPAGPLFYPPPVLPALIGPNVASFVDIVHTNRGLYGYPINLGQIDFNVNGGGPLQPGCSNLTDTFCSHNKAPMYYAQSIGRTDLIAKETCLLCTRKVIFGENCPPGSTGLYNIDLTA